MDAGSQEDGTRWFSRIVGYMRANQASQKYPSATGQSPNHRRFPAVQLPNHHPESIFSRSTIFLFNDSSSPKILNNTFAFSKSPSIPSDFSISTPRPFFPSASFSPFNLECPVRPVQPFQFLNHIPFRVIFLFDHFLFQQSQVFKKFHLRLRALIYFSIAFRSNPSFGIQQIFNIFSATPPPIHFSISSIQRHHFSVLASLFLHQGLRFKHVSFDYLNFQHHSKYHFPALFTDLFSLDQFSRAFQFSNYRSTKNLNVCSLAT